MFVSWELYVLHRLLFCRFCAPHVSVVAKRLTVSTQSEDIMIVILDSCKATDIVVVVVVVVVSQRLVPTCFLV